MNTEKMTGETQQPKVLIVAYKKDPAALNIADKLITMHHFTRVDTMHDDPLCYASGSMKLIYSDIDDVHADEFDRKFLCDLIVFASRHKSDREEPTLTTHVSGNLSDDAILGGLPKRLALAHPQRMGSALRELSTAATELGLDRYSVSLEATHHGPTELNVPSYFVEIGSTAREWSDPKAGEAAARAIHAAATFLEDRPSAVGFGGGHYSVKHTKLTLAGDYCVGHILPKYFFDDYDPALVKLAFERTIGNCRLAVLDWKGIRGGQRRRLLVDLNELQVEVIRV